jgi:uncharacterized membrane protein HdeD (DUF308 family)
MMHTSVGEGAKRARHRHHLDEENRHMTMAMPQQTVARITSNWWALALRGVVALLLGFFALTRPGITFSVLVAVLGVYMFADGVLGIAAAVRGIRAGDRWGWMMVSGVLGIIAGTIVLFRPGVGASVLVVLVALWALLHGVFEIMAGIKLRKIIEGEWMLILAGVLAVALGIWILMRPTVAVVLLVTWVGVYALFAGIVMLALAFRIRKWSKEHELPA